MKGKNHAKVVNPWSGAALCGQDGDINITSWHYWIKSPRVVTCRKCRAAIRRRAW